MLKRQKRQQGELFLAGSLKDLIPEDHILKKIDRILDLSWLRREVADLYDLTNGRPGIDPEAAVRLMLAGFSQGILKDRKLMREAQVNLGKRPANRIWWVVGGWGMMWPWKERRHGQGQKTKQTAREEVAAAD